MPVLKAKSIQTTIPADSTLYDDIVRFDHFSDQYLAYHPEYETIIGDARYGILPTSLEPLWGIEINISETDRHAVFKTFRDPDRMSAQIQELWDMICGRGGETINPIKE